MSPQSTQENLSIPAYFPRSKPVPTLETIDQLESSLKEVSKKAELPRMLKISNKEIVAGRDTNEPGTLSVAGMRAH